MIREKSRQHGNEGVENVSSSPSILSKPGQDSSKHRCSPHLAPISTSTNTLIQYASSGNTQDIMKGDEKQTHSRWKGNLQVYGGGRSTQVVKKLPFSDPKREQQG